MFSRIGSAAFKKDLDNIRILCDKLGNPQKQFQSIHIGGTNGKGSVSHMLSAIFQQQGYKTGLYTSPHLFDFRERIKVNGTELSEEFVIDFVARLQPLIEEIEPSFFEITVAMAFEYFKTRKVDVAIIEVGLGGRLDSTNIINPLVSVITNIGWDHMNMLGNTLEEIAFEKAGIIKNNTPVVIGERQAITDPIFISAAKERNAPLYFAEDNFSVESYKWINFNLHINITKDNKIKTYVLDLPGIYQLKNILTVLQTVNLLKSQYNIDDQSVTKALSHVKSLTGLKGRWEMINEDPKVIVEVAHNIPGIDQLLQQLNQLSFNKLHIIFAMVKDKSPDDILNLLPQQATYYWTQSHIPRALAAFDLKEVGDKLNLQGLAYDNVNDALAHAINSAESNDLILICGSIFLAAELETKWFKNPIVQAS